MPFWSQERFRPCLGDGHGLQCHCRRQSLLAVGGHISVSRDTSRSDPHGATLSLALSLHCGVTVTATGLVHVSLFSAKLKPLSMSSPLLKRNRPCQNPRAPAPAHVRHVSTQLSPDTSILGARARRQWLQVCNQTSSSGKSLCRCQPRLSWLLSAWSCAHASAKNC